MTGLILGTVQQHVVMVYSYRPEHVIIHHQSVVELRVPEVLSSMYPVMMETVHAPTTMKYLLSDRKLQTRMNVLNGMSKLILFLCKLQAH